MKIQNTYFILSLWAITLCYACNNQTPEEAGKQEGLKQCDCVQLNHTSEAKNDANAYAQIQQGINEGKIKSRRDVPQLNLGRGADADTCWKELERMKQQQELQFAKEEDRKTIENAFASNLKPCSEQYKDSQGKLFEEIEKTRMKIQEVVSKLPY
jgi:hypothetical protein